MPACPPETAVSVRKRHCGGSLTQAAFTTQGMSVSQWAPNLLEVSQFLMPAPNWDLDYFKPHHGHDLVVTTTCKCGKTKAGDVHVSYMHSNSPASCPAQLIA